MTFSPHFGILPVPQRILWEELHDLKALSYFEEGDLDQLSQAVKERIIKAVKSVDLSSLPNLERGVNPQ